MTNDGALYYTRKGYEEEKAKLEYLKGEKRDEIIKRIETARGFGDLSENAEYDEARKDQRENEAEIQRLEARLSNVIIYDENDLSCDSVQIGHFVTVKCLWNSKVVEYQLVGSAEANPLEGKISNAAPVGIAISGKKVGDVVDVTVPNGIRQYKILKIRTPD